MKKIKLVIILGPTASGKSALAVRIAKKFNGDIVSADSRQVYRGLNLASGKISKKEMARIPHHCLDIASLKTRFTVAQWKKCAERAIWQIANGKKLPIVVGGTAFYINALIYKNYFPEVKPNWQLRKRLERKSAAELFKILKKLDQRRAKTIDENNPRRLIRAIEIIKQTGMEVPALNRELRDDFDILILGLKKSRKELEKGIRARLKKRLRQGMIREIKDLRKGRMVSWKRLDELGLEPRWIALFLQRKISRKEMEAGIIRDSLKFARRQMAWWRGDEKIRWIRAGKEAGKLTNQLLN